MASKIDKEVNQDGSDKRCEEEGTLRKVKRGQTALSFRWINDDSKRCLVVEDANLKLGSEEWLFHRHLRSCGIPLNYSLLSI